MTWRASSVHIYFRPFLIVLKETQKWTCGWRSLLYPPSSFWAGDNKRWGITNNGKFLTKGRFTFNIFIGEKFPFIQSNFFIMLKQGHITLYIQLMNINETFIYKYQHKNIKYNSSGLHFCQTVQNIKPKKNNQTEWSTQSHRNYLKALAHQYFFTKCIDCNNDVHTSREFI